MVSESGQGLAPTFSTVVLTLGSCSDHVRSKSDLARMRGIPDRVQAIMATYVSLTIYQGGYGQGRHQWNVPLSWFFNFLKVRVLFLLPSMAASLTVGPPYASWSTSSRSSTAP